MMGISLVGLFLFQLELIMRGNGLGYRSLSLFEFLTIYNAHSYYNT